VPGETGKNLERAQKAESLPENVRAAAARARGVEPIIVEDGTGRTASVFVNSKTGETEQFSPLSEAEVKNLKGTERGRAEVTPAEFDEFAARAKAGEPFASGKPDVVLEPERLTAGRGQIEEGSGPIDWSIPPPATPLDARGADTLTPENVPYDNKPNLDVEPGTNRIVENGKPTNRALGPDGKIVPYEAPPVPESPETLNAQIESAADPDSPRVAVFYPESEPNGLTVKVGARVMGFARIPVEGGQLLVKVSKARALGLNSAKDIKQYVEENGFESLIGKVAPVKDTSQGPALRTEDAQGNELSTSIVPTPEAAKAQAEVDRQQFPQAASQEVLPAQEAAQRRIEEKQSPAPKIDLTGMVRGIGENLRETYRASVEKTGKLPSQEKGSLLDQLYEKAVGTGLPRGVETLNRAFKTLNKAEAINGSGVERAEAYKRAFLEDFQSPADEGARAPERSRSLQSLEDLRQRASDQLAGMDMNDSRRESVSSRLRDVENAIEEETRANGNDQSGTGRSASSNRNDSAGSTAIDRQNTQTPEAAKQPRQWRHADFGLVTEAESQSGVGQNRARVTGEDGTEHIIQTTDGRGRGNELAVPVRRRNGFVLKPKESPNAESNSEGAAQSVAPESATAPKERGNDVAVNPEAQAGVEKAGVPAEQVGSDKLQVTSSQGQEQQTPVVPAAETNRAVAPESQTRVNMETDIEIGDSYRNKQTGEVLAVRKVDKNRIFLGERGSDSGKTVSRPPDQFRKQFEKTEHKFSSTQVDLPEGTAKQVRALGEKLIPDSELYTDPNDDSYGREENPHITVKYGLHDEVPDKVRELLANEPPATASLGKVSIFPGKGDTPYDVVKADVESPDLHRINKLISDNVKVTDTHPEYKPHVTLAYVKKGEGQKYVGNNSLEGQKLTFDGITFSSSNGETVNLPLAGKSATPAIKAQGSQPSESGEWQNFSEDSGTLGIPRASMPQIKSEHRGAMTQFLKGRGITHEQVEVRPDSLKPSQQEFSPAKVEKALGFEGPDRSILISSDGYVLDGHHQWLAALRTSPDKPYPAIRFDAPIKSLLLEAARFPSSGVDESTSLPPAGKSQPDISKENIPLEGQVSRTSGKQNVQPAKSTQDDLYNRAVEITKELNRASTHSLQRELKIGYGDAANLIDRMKAEGIVGKTGTYQPESVRQKTQAKLDKVANRKPRQPMRGDPAKHNLFDYLSYNGGIRPSDAVDLSALKGLKKGIRPLVNQNGKDVEDAMRDAIESGYLSGQAKGYATEDNYDRSAFTVDDFVNAIAESERSSGARGNQPHYSAQNEIQAELERELEDMSAGEIEPVFTLAERLANFLEDTEVSDLLKKTEKGTELSSDDLDNLRQIAQYQYQLEGKDYEPLILEAIQRGADNQKGASASPGRESSQVEPAGAALSPQGGESLYAEDDDSFDFGANRKLDDFHQPEQSGFGFSQAESGLFAEGGAKPVERFEAPQNATKEQKAYAERQYKEQELTRALGKDNVTTLAGLQEEDISPRVRRFASQIVKASDRVDTSLLDDTLPALEKLAELDRTHTPVSDYVNQPQLIGERELTPEQEGVLSEIDRTGKLPDGLIREPANMREVASGLNDLFGGAPLKMARLDVPPGIGFPANQIRAELRNFARDVDAVVNGTARRGDVPEVISSAPPLLRRLGLIDAEIKMPHSVVEKAIGTAPARDHNIDPEELKRLPLELNDPVMVFKSLSDDNSIVVVTQLANRDGFPVVAAIKYDGEIGRVRVNVIPTVHEKNRARFVQDWIDKGKLLYYSKEKGPDWLRKVGLKLPETEAQIAANPKILTEDNFVNGAMKMARRDETLRAEENVGNLAPQVTSTRDRNIVTINHEGAEIARRAIAPDAQGLETSASFDGLFLEPRQVREVVKALRGLTEDMLDPEFGYSAEDVQPLKDLTQNILDAQRERKTVVLKVTDAALAHEKFHEGSYLGSDGKEFEDRHARIDELGEHAAVKAWRRFYSNTPENANASRGRAVEEAAATIAGGDYAKMGVSDEEAGDFLELWTRSFREKNGPNAFDYFEEQEPHVKEAIRQARASAVAEGQEQGISGAGDQAGRPARGRPAGAATGSLPEVRPEAEGEADTSGRGEVKQRSLPATLRAQGLRAADALYLTHTDKAAASDAKALLEEHGLEGSIALLKTVPQPGAEHVLLFKIVSEALQNTAAQIKESQPEDAERLMREQDALTQDVAERFTTSGQFIRAAQLLADSVESLGVQAERLAKKRGRELTPKERERIKRKGEGLESANANEQLEAAEVARTKRLQRLSARLLARVHNREQRLKELDGQMPARPRRANTSVEQVRKAARQIISPDAEALKAQIMASLSGSSNAPLKMAVPESKTTPANLSEQQLADLARYGSLTMLEQKPSERPARDELTKAWRARMLNDFGNSIEPHLDDIHAQALRLKRSALNQARFEKLVERFASENPDLDQSDIEDMANEELQSRRLRRIAAAEHNRLAAKTERVQPERVREREQKAEAKKIRDLEKRTAELRQKIQEKNLAQKAKPSAAVSAELTSLRAEHKTLVKELNRLRREANAKPSALLNAIGSLASTEEQVRNAVKLSMPGMTPGKFAEELKAEDPDLSTREARQAFKDAARILEAARRVVQSEKDVRGALLREKAAETALERDRALVNYQNARADNTRARQEVARVLKMLEKRRLGKVLAIAGEIVDAPKSIMMSTMASMDVSGIGRQGLPLAIMHPSAAPDLVKEAFKGYFDTPAAKNIDYIENHEDFPLLVRAGVNFSTAGGRGEGEEFFRGGQYLEKIPLIKQTLGEIVRRSDQSYGSGLDRIRLEVGSAWVNMLRAQGKTWKDNPEDFRTIARAINIFSGRGDIGPHNARATRVLHGLLNLVSFAPRYRMSRLQMSTLPLNSSFLGAPSAARRIVYKNYFKWRLAVGLTLGLLSLLGFKVSYGDPDDSSWLKGQIGDQKFDLTSGVGLQDRFISRLAVEAYRGLTGQVTGKMALGQLGSLAGRWFQSGLRPDASLGYDWFTGEDFEGQPFHWGGWDGALASRMLPLGITQTAETWKRQGAGYAASSATAEFFGFGSNIYRERTDVPHTRAEKLAARFVNKDGGSSDLSKEIKDKLAELKDRARAGEDVTSELEPLVEAEKITQRKADSIANAKNQTYLQEKVRELSLEDAEHVLKYATDAEKASVADIMRRKRLNKVERDTKEEQKRADPERTKDMKERSQRAQQRKRERQEMRYGDQLPTYAP
jgi:2'-5' RNA ligase